MTVSDQQVEYFTEDALKYVPDKPSPDVTLHVFQFIEKNPGFSERYKVLRKGDPRVNARIAQVIKRLLNRENWEEVAVPKDPCSLVRSYMRFKP